MPRLTQDSVQSTGAGHLIAPYRVMYDADHSQDHECGHQRIGKQRLASDHSLRIGLSRLHAADFGYAK